MNLFGRVATTTPWQLLKECGVFFIDTSDKTGEGLRGWQINVRE
jgi:hypothetical protein